MDRKKTRRLGLRDVGKGGEVIVFELVRLIQNQDAVHCAKVVRDGSSRGVGDERTAELEAVHEAVADDLPDPCRVSWRSTSEVGAGPLRVIQSRYSKLTKGAILQLLAPLFLRGKSKPRSREKGKKVEERTMRASQAGEIFGTTSPLLYTRMAVRLAREKSSTMVAREKAQVEEVFFASNSLREPPIG
jgi:hypothetical protein